MTGSTLPTKALTPNLVESGLADTAPTSLWKDAWRRLLRNPEGVFGLTVIGLFILIAVFAPFLAPYEVADTNIKLDNRPPFWVKQSAIGISGDPRFILGTDRSGRDLLSWGIYGTRTSMMLGLISAPIIALVGTLVGLISGYAGGWVDNLIMRITDVFYAFPQLMICILVVILLRETVFGYILSGMLLFFIAFLSVGWAGAARLVRGSVLAVKSAEYVEAARCVGVPPARLVFKHILPNCLSPLIVWTTLTIPQLILTEAILRYLNISPSSTLNRSAFFDASWGGMIMEGRSLIHVHPIVVIIPAVCIGLISIAFTFLGDALRDALDPRHQQARSQG